MNQSDRTVTVHVPDPRGNWTVYGVYDHELAAVMGAGNAIDEGYQTVKVCTTVTYLASENGGGLGPRTA